jgi:hypothetical protein
MIYNYILILNAWLEIRTPFATPLFMEIFLAILKEHDSSHSSSCQQAPTVSSGSSNALVGVATTADLGMPISFREGSIPSLIPWQTKGIKVDSMN